MTRLQSRLILRRLLTVVAGACIAAAAVACGADLSAPPPPRATVIAGDRQFGAPGTALAAPLVIEAVDASGQPVPGVAIDWVADGGGVVVPQSAVTDGGGRVAAAWTLGPAAGEQHAHAAVAGTTVADFTATSGPMSTPEPLLLDTPDGSGQTVHPDYVAMPASWPHDPDYLVITPYPGGNASFENPSLFSGPSPIAWMAPAGLANPLVRPPSGGYLSDPDAVAVPDLNELWVYYRQVTADNSIFLIRSPDGVHFTSPTLVAAAEDHDIVSPAVVRRGPSDWWMWSVNSNVGCSSDATTVELRRSTDGIHWQPPTQVTLSQPGFFAWHIDVQWIPSRQEFWAVYNGKTPGSCTTPALFLATSADGIAWHTFASPILSRGVIPEFTDVVYRSTFHYDAGSDAIDFWYSGARYTGKEYVWRSAYQRRSREEVFATAAKPPSQAVLARIAGPSKAPPLVDAP